MKEQPTITSRIFSRLDLQLLVRRRPFFLVLSGLLLFAPLLILHQPPPAARQSTPDLHRQAHTENQFRQLLLAPNELAAARQALLDSAQALSLKIGRIDYTQEDDAQAGFSRSSLRLPLSGHYADLRTLIEHSLRQQNALVIRQLSIERLNSEAADSAVQATLTVEFLVAGDAR